MIVNRHRFSFSLYTKGGCLYDCQQAQIFFPVCHKGWLPDALWLSGESSPSEADRCLFSLEAGTLTGGGPLRPSSGYASATEQQPCKWIHQRSCFRERHSKETRITNMQRLLNGEEQQQWVLGNSTGEAREEDRRLILGRRVGCHPCLWSIVMWANSNSNICNI